MRVLHIHSGNLFGGVETFLVTLAQCRGLSPEMEPEFALCFPGRLKDELTTAGARGHDLGPVRASRPWTVLRARRRLTELLAGSRFDLIVCHMSWAQALFGGTVRRRGPGFVAYYHNPTGGGWLEWVAARQRPLLLIAPSEHAARTWQVALPGVRAEVLNYPLPPRVSTVPDLTSSERTALRAELGAGPEDTVILQASRIEPWKGPDLTLRALGQLRDVPKWRLWIAGGVQRPHEQSLYNTLIRITAETGIADRVSFLGQRTDVPSLMRAADVYCQGNRGPEGFSLSFLEASYCRMPIVTTDLGGASEMIDPTTGILVPTGEDAGALAAALRRLLQEPDLRIAMGKRAREKAVRLCDTGQQLQRLAGYFTEVIRENG